MTPFTRIPWAGVYAIENTITRRVYVGMSANVEKRLHEHAQDMKRGLTNHRRMRPDLKAHGFSSFHFVVLERTFEIQKLDALELLWATRLQAHGELTGYNVAPIKVRSPMLTHCEQQTPAPQSVEIPA